MKIKDLTGMKFTRLTVLERTESPAHLKRKYVFWRCLCDCGNHCSVMSAALRNGATKSCGCLKKETNGNQVRLQYGEANFRYLFNRYKARARTNKLDFRLTKEEFRSLTKQNCYYCGFQPNQIVAHPDHYGEYIYNGIDRKDNSIGYILENCVPCCKKCNRAKNDLSMNEFNEWISRLVEFNKERSGF